MDIELILKALEFIISFHYLYNYDEVFQIDKENK